MSSDFVVFDPTFAPREGQAFRAWHEQQTDWDIDAPFPAPTILTEPLRAWYDAMTAQFPDIEQTDTDSDDGISCSFTSHLILCSVVTRRENIKGVWKLGRELVEKSGLGFYDCMSDDGHDNRCIVFPEGPLANEPSWLSRMISKLKG